MQTFDEEFEAVWARLLAALIDAPIECDECAPEGCTADDDAEPITERRPIGPNEVETVPVIKTADRTGT